MKVKKKKKERVPIAWSDRIIRLRRKNDWSQKELAAKLGCTIGSVFNWEHGTIPLERYQNRILKLVRG